GVRVIWEIAFSRRHASPLQIKRMAFRQIERCRIAPKSDRDSFEVRGIFSSRRLPRFFFNLVKVYFAHNRFLSFRPKWRNLLLFFFSSLLAPLANSERCLDFAGHDNRFILRRRNNQSLFLSRS